MLKLVLRSRPGVYCTPTRWTHRNHPGHKAKPLATVYKPRLADNYLDAPNYPPIKPKYPPGVFSADYDQKLAWTYFEEGQKFHSLKTIQERLTVLAYLNAQATLDDLGSRSTRYYPIYKLSASPKSARSLKFNQYVSKTDIKVGDELPKNQPLNNISDSLYENIKTSVRNVILANYLYKEEIDEVVKVPRHPDSYVPEVFENEKKRTSIEMKSDSLIKEILNTITTSLSAAGQCGHLVNAQYGNDVDVRGYWKRCGFKEQKPRGAVNPDQDTIRFQFEDVASYQIKCDMPLKPVYKLDDPKCSEGQIEKFAYNPSNFKIFADHLLPMQVPGHWYGDSREFNYLTVFNTTRMFEYMRSKYGDFNEDFDAIKSMAVTSGLAELTAQAYYLGFSMWKDLTYPLMGQYLFTNGQDFSLGNYQLNTLKLWNNSSGTNNLCFLTVPQRLFELSDDRTEIKSFNDDLLKRIISVLMTEPVRASSEVVEKYSEIDYMLNGTALRPYLAVQDFEKQLTIRHKLLAISLYELVKYDRPTSYLNLRDESKPVMARPRLPRLYDKYTYEFRDIVLDYYPRDYHGFKLVERLLKVAPKQSEKFWDLKQPVYEWANVPPPDTNNIPRKIDLEKF